MEQNLTDALTEARIAADAAAEEQAIVDLEHEVAERMRGICRDLFGGTTKYRIPTTNLVVVEATPVYQGVGASLTLGDRLERVLRVTTRGEIVTATIYLGDREGFRCYIDPAGYMRGAKEDDWDVDDDTYPFIIPATDEEIAAHAPAIARQLIAALRKRVDTARKHRLTLTRMRDAMAAPAPME